MARKNRIHVRLPTLVILVLVIAGMGWFPYMRFQGVRLQRPLIQAVKNQDAARVGVLLHWGADPDSRDTSSEKPVGIWELLNSLLQRNTSARRNRGKTALMLAAAKKDAVCARLLLQGGADVNARDEAESAALLETVRKDSEPGGNRPGAVEKTMDILLDHGAYIDAQDGHGMTTLMYLFVSTYDETEACEHLLLERGASVRLENQHGETALLYAIDAHQYRVEGFRQHLIEPLLSKGADVNAPTHQRFTSLMLAAINGDAEVVGLLLAKGAHVNDQDGNGISPLMYASSGNDRMLVDFYLEREQDYGLYCMRDSGDGAKVVTLLLDHSGRIGARDRYGRTALMYAARPHHIEIVKILLKRGADVNARDSNGYSVWRWALSYNSPLFSVLKQAGARE